MSDSVIVTAKAFPEPESLALISDIQFREPYSSAAINRKFRGILLAGIYKGFNPTPGDGLNLLISSGDGGGTVSVDIGQYYQLSIRQQADLTVAMAAATSKIVALQATYALGKETYQVNTGSDTQAAEIVLLDTSAALAANQVELCKVTIPAGATQITTDMIDLSGRVSRSIGIELSSAIDSDSEEVAANSLAVKNAISYIESQIATAVKTATLTVTGDTTLGSLTVTDVSYFERIRANQYLDLGYQNGTAGTRQITFYSGSDTTNTGYINVVGSSSSASIMTIKAGSLSLNGSTSISGALSVSSSLTVAGSAAFSNDVTVAGTTTLGNASFTQDVEIAGSMTVTGPVYLNWHDAPLIFSSSDSSKPLIAVNYDGNGNYGIWNNTDGAWMLYRDTSGAWNMPKGLSVSGSTALASTLQVSGAASFGSSLTVSGAAALSSTLTVGSTLTASGEIISKNSNGFRIVQGSYGQINRFDGGSFYLLFTSSGDQYGTWNSLRPFSVSATSGDVTMAHNVTVNGTLNATSNVNVSGSMGVSGTLTGSGVIQAKGYLWSSGLVYSGAGASYLQGDGNVYGGCWGGYLNNWIGANFSRITSTVQDVRLGSLITTSTGMAETAGYVITAVYGGNSIDACYGRPLQKLINGSWITVSTA